ncbi:MAG: hypothetical protein KAG53_06880 [Endozoicomonadaceae bacterium]|nr:hypothetical protein [Endozoicomonadaceae bacterium]
MLRTALSIKKWVLLAVVLSLLSACSVLNRKIGYCSVDIREQWAILPIEAATEDVSIQVERLLTRILTDQGFSDLQLPPKSSWVSDKNKSLQYAHKLKNALQWTKNRGISRGVTGTVNRWERDDEGRPQVSLTIKLLDISFNATLWTNMGNGDGQSEELISDVADDLIQMLLISLMPPESSSPPSPSGKSSL